MNSLKTQYNLPYDTSGFNSGLINWYNRLINKSYDELDVIDVCKMIRQDVLKDVAINKAIEIFLKDPYAGEYNDGELLSVFISLDMKLMDTSSQRELQNILENIQKNQFDFEWDNEKAKANYVENTDIMLNKLRDTLK